MLSCAHLFLIWRGAGSGKAMPLYRALELRHSSRFCQFRGVPLEHTVSEFLRSCKHKRHVPRSNRARCDNEQIEQAQ